MAPIFTVYEPQTLSANKLTKCWKNTMHGFRKKKNTKKDKGREDKMLEMASFLNRGCMSDS